MAKLIFLVCNLVLLNFALGGIVDNEIIRSLYEEKPTSSENHWALIIAGSNGWYNYRHQADACHAYQIMLKHGIPEERIITMMYDDIANNEENPTPGVVINFPGGKDVYQGVKIDYREEDVTPEVFLSVLQGEEEAVRGKGTGRVIKSGPNDHVFVNFADHGAPGLIAFPAGELKASQLMAAIKNMYKAKKYKQMVLYIEACESGSMFEGLLPDDINVYATTAANSHESSYACYFDQDRKTYLGDVYSVKWMEDSDAEDLSSETLKKQFAIVKQKTNTSHVQEFGDMSISKEPVADFQGGTTYVAPKPEVVPEVPLDAVASEQVPMAILSHKLALAQTKEEEFKIMAEMESLMKLHADVEATFNHIVSISTKDGVKALRMMKIRHQLTNLECYEATVDAFDAHCYDLSTTDFALRKLYSFVNMCEEGVSAETIISAINQIC